MVMMLAETTTRKKENNQSSFLLNGSLMHLYLLTRSQLPFVVDFEIYIMQT